jgi:hypothetical protein
MTDLRDKIQAALDRAAKYELLGGLAVDREKRREYRTLAKFNYSIAYELRDEIQPPAKADGAQPLKDASRAIATASNSGF